MKISWLVLTYNRFEKVQRAITHNMALAGRQWDELIWVDNGSTDGVRSFMESLKPNVSVLHKENLGVAVGYNRAMVMATGDYLVITGCDMLMPVDWLKTLEDYFKKIPNTGIACMYSGPLSWVPERVRGPERVESGLRYVPAMPIGRRMYSRKLLKKIGYLREDFGLYGWEDVEWGYRAERVCAEQGLKTYVIPDQIAEHLGTEGSQRYDGQDERAYHEFKQREAEDPRKKRMMVQLERDKWPYYNPYL